MMSSFLVLLIENLVFLYDLVTWPLYYILQTPWKKQEAAKRVRALPLTRNKDITYKSVSPPSNLVRKLISDGINTMTKALDYSVRIHKHKRCLGTRQIFSEEEETQPNGKVFSKFVMGEYEWMTYEELGELTDKFGKGLRELNMKEKDKVIIFAETRSEWMISAMGAFTQNFIIVTLYATLGEEALIHGISQTDAKHIITSHDQLPKLKKVLERTPNIEHVVYMENHLKKTNTDGYKQGVKFYPYKSVLEMGSRSDKSGVSPQPDDTAMVMYTSGSTGVPKGVIVTHSNITSALFRIANIFIDNLSPDARYLAFLPLAHILELIVENGCLLAGYSIGYSSPLTITEKSSKVKRGTQGDASMLKPTVLASVPLILDRISKNVWDNVNKAGDFSRELFMFAYEYKRKWSDRGYTTPIIDRLFFSRIRALLGGEVEMIISGGAPLSPQTHEFIRTVLSCPLVQGYGLTETCACSTCMDTDDLSTGKVGPPLSGVHLRLINWEEGDYRITDKPYPRGEIVIGGQFVAKGYYKLPDKTIEDFLVKDGKRWFKTGDIGQIERDGTLKIIDRKKDLVKLQFGEYVSLGKVESVLKTLPVVDNICVYVDSTRDYVVSLVVPLPDALKELAERAGVSTNLHIQDMCADRAVREAVLKEIQAQGKKTGLEKFEIPAAVTLCHEEWTPDTDLVTAALKLKRRNIKAKFQKEIDAMYAQ